MNLFITLEVLISVSLRSRRRMVCQSSAWVDAHQRGLSRLCCCCGRRQMIHQITAYTVYKIANGNVFIKSETEFGRAKVTKQTLPPPSDLSDDRVHMCYVVCTALVKPPAVPPPPQKRVQTNGWAWHYFPARPTHLSWCKTGMAPLLRTSLEMVGTLNFDCYKLGGLIWA